MCLANVSGALLSTLIIIILPIMILILSGCVAYSDLMRSVVAVMYSKHTYRI